MEDRGIDEVYIDFTHAPEVRPKEGARWPCSCRQAIFAATGLTCSVGVAPNKLLAKMASEFNKPRGIAIVCSRTTWQEKIWPLPCRKINGIGPKAGAKLQALGIDDHRAIWRSLPGA